ncbi:MAG: 50S ribosomal protein L18 [Patescibacteria group bacterium]
MSTALTRKISRTKRHTRIRTRIFGTALRPRLSFFRSNQHVYAQIIDDEAGKTLAASSDIGFDDKGKVRKSKRAEMVGERIAAEAKGKKISAVVFDRGGFLYAGAVKAFADAARKGGLTF